VSCSELQCVTGLVLSETDRMRKSEGVALTLLFVAVCCRELQGVAVSCSELQ